MNFFYSEHEDLAAKLNSRIIEADSRYEILKSDNEASLAKVEKLNQVLCEKDENLERIKSKLEVNFFICLNIV